MRKIACFLLLASLLISGCVKTVTETKIEYVSPDIPKALLDPCGDLPFNATTNGELLIAYISLQTAYLLCASKVSSIGLILKSYDDLYSITDHSTSLDEQPTN